MNEVGTHPGSLLRRFLTIARCQPDTAAVATAAGGMTFGELAEASSRAAQVLTEYGVRAGNRVLVLAAREPTLVVAMLGAWRCAAAVSIVDPAHPDQYLAACADALSPRLVIDLPGHGRPGLERLPVVDASDLDSPAGTPGQTSEPGPDDTAVVTFTSGTTGAPRAVAGRYSSLSYFFDWMDARWGPLAGARFGLCSALGHDPLQRDLTTPTFLGGA